jgi:hypothetical protein
MRPNQEQVDLKREQKAIAKQNNIRVQQGQNPLPMPTREIMSQHRDIPPGPSVNYLYQAKIKNEGTKIIRSVEWEYLLADLETNTELGRHHFSDTLKLRPGKSTTLSGYTASPPNTIVNGSMPVKGGAPKYAERVVLTRIEYEDGSSWQRPLSE